jgi:glucan phosphorylase
MMAVEPRADTIEAEQPQQGKTEQAQEKAQEVAGQAREKAQEAAGEARSRLRDQVDQRSTQAGERINSTSSDLRSMGEELRKQGKDAPARLADQAADRVERVGGYLAESGADRILGDLEDFGRRQPLAVLAGGMVLGIVAARFLKASSSRRYRSRTAGANGANHPDHAQRTVSAWEAGTAPPAQAEDVRPATPDPGEHHQRFEGHG